MKRLYDLFYYVLHTRPVDDRELDNLLGRGTRKVSYRRGEVIITSYDRAQCCYIIYEGVCEGTHWSPEGVKDTFTIRKLPAITGEASMINRMPHHTNNIVAVDEVVRVIEIDNDYFYSELQEDTRLCMLMMKDMASKLVRVSNKVIQRHFYTSSENFLLYVHECWQHSGGGLPFVLHQSNRSIADELGVSERTVYRALKEYCGQGLFRVEEGDLVLDEARAPELEARAGALKNINY